MVGHFQCTIKRGSPSGWLRQPWCAFVGEDRCYFRIWSKMCYLRIWYTIYRFFCSSNFIVDLYFCKSIFSYHLCGRQIGLDFLQLVFFAKIYPSGNGPISEEGFSFGIQLFEMFLFIYWLFNQTNSTSFAQFVPYWNRFQKFKMDFGAFTKKNYRDPPEFQ